MEDKEIKENKRLTAVLYTDGSAGPSNPGFYGSGVHGYLFDESCINVKNTDTAPGNNFITTKGYTMIDVTNNKNVHTVKPLKYIEAVYSFGNDIKSNNVAELLAISKIVRTMLDDKELDVEHFVIKTDSQYAKDSVWTRLILRKRTHFDYRTEPDLKNKEHYADALAILEECAERNIRFDIYKTPAHADSLGNNIADRLAFTGKEASINSKTLEAVQYTATKFWKAKHEPAPFLKVREVYFTHDLHERMNGNRFCIMEYPTDVDTGKKHNGAMFGVIDISDIDAKGLLDIVEFDNKYARGLSQVTAIDTAVYFSSDHVRYKNMLGTDAYNYKNGTTKLLGRDLLALPTRPQGLAKIAIDMTEDLNVAMDRFMKYREDGKVESNNIHYVDITEDIYEIPEQDEKSKKKKPYVIKIGQTDKHVKFKKKVKFADKERELSIILTLGVEITPRNTLKKLEKLDPKVYLEFDRKTDKSVSYNVIIATKENVGIYTNQFTSSIIL